MLRRLDHVITPNLSGIAQDIVQVLPDDTPPAGDETGNIPQGCFGVYNNTPVDGYIRLITRNGIRVSATPVHHPVQLLIGGQPAPVQLQIGGQLVPIVWQSGNPQTVRVWVPAGHYALGRISHVLLHETTVGDILALVT